MVGLIIITHGIYASSLIKSLEMVSGKIEKIEAIELEQGESIESLQEKIKKTIIKLDTAEVLIMVDLLGGTPYNASSIELQNPNINIITGINMPMILEILPHRNEGIDIVSQIATDGGKNGILNVKDRYDYLNKEKDIF
jgi:mannose/fructose/sorbose-specific phosphotransferase system IIA component